MNTPRCPGQDMRFWKPDDIFCMDCPWCGEEIEFWKDEPVRLCSCGKEVRNPRLDEGCLQWCKFAAECAGSAPGQSSPGETVRETLIAETRKLLGDDAPAIALTYETLKFAEKILESEGGDGLAVRAAAIVQPLIAQSISTAHTALKSAGLPGDLIQRVFQLAEAAKRPDADSPLEARILSDAAALANYSVRRESSADGPPSVFYTREGQKLGERLSRASQ